MYPSLIQPSLDGVKFFRIPQFLDERGSFSAVWTTGDLDGLMRGSFRQLNVAESKQGVLRGLHRQDQSKLVFPISGTIYDVAVNVETKEWFGTVLHEGEALFIPPQYAHGYFVMSDVAVVSYVVDTPYCPSDEEVFPWNGYGINWPLSITPLLSSKDNTVSLK